MKKLKKRTLAVIFVGLITLLAAGCGKMTPETLTKKVAQNIKENPVTCGEIDMDLKLSYGADLMGMGLNMDLAMKLAMEAMADPETFENYTDSTVTLSMMGQEMTTDLIFHTLNENHQMVTYTYTGATDSWYRTESGLSPAEYKNFVLSIPSFDALQPETMLEEETKEIGGKEVYVLHVTYTGEDLQGLLSGVQSAGIMGEEIPAESFAGIKAPSILYVDTKTLLPVQIEIDVEGLESWINKIVEQQMGALEEQDISVSVEIEDYHLVMKDLEYGAQKLPELPPEAKDASSMPEEILTNIL